MLASAATLAQVAQSPDAFDAVVRPFAADGRFMGTVLVARGDNVIFSKAYGSANLEWNIPNDTSTKFRIGSITKQFTAAAILLLEQDGKLSVQDLLSRHVDNIPASWKEITLFHLLTHTSGIRNFTALPDYQRQAGAAELARQTSSSGCAKSHSTSFLARSSATATPGISCLDS